MLRHVRGFEIKSSRHPGPPWQGEQRAPTTRSGTKEIDFVETSDQKNFFALEFPRFSSCTFVAFVLFVLKVLNFSGTA
jgi:hypothetical protein